MGICLQVRADKPAEGRVLLWELVSGRLSQNSSVKAVLIRRVHYESFL